MDNILIYKIIKNKQKKKQTLVTKAIQRSINIKNKLYHKYIKIPYDTNKNEYKNYKKILFKLLK